MKRKFKQRVNNSTNINKTNNNLSPKERLNSDSQQFHQYQQNEQPLILTHGSRRKKTTTYDVGNPGPRLWQWQQCGGDKLVNGYINIQSCTRIVIHTAHALHVCWQSIIISSVTLWRRFVQNGLFIGFRPFKLFCYLLIYVICVCLRIAVSNTYCVLFLFNFFLVLCALCCQFLWFDHFWLPLRCSLTFICSFIMTTRRRGGGTTNI